MRFSKSDRRGLLLFTALCAAVLAAFLYFSQPTAEDDSHLAKPLTQDEQAELHAFEEEIRADSLAWAAKRGKDYAQGAERVVETFPFDPNTADSLTLLRLGLRPWQAKAMHNYRRKGGRWRSAEDFRRLYGLSEADYQRLKPYIRISPEFADPSRPHEKSEKQLAWEARQAYYDSLRATYPKKYEEGSVHLNLNTCDTTALKGIPGIGSWYAQKIVRYRESLGGFVNVAQLREVEGLPKDVERWFDPATAITTPRQIDINRASFQTLVRHPYLNYEQTKEIVQFIQKRGPLRSWNDLRLSKYFTPNDFQRLAPYFRF